MTLPSTAPRSSTAKSKRARPAQRKRGGQRGNQNARTHGAFSVYQPTRLSRLVSQAKTLEASFISDTQSLATTITEMQKTVVKLMTAADKLKSPSRSLIRLEGRMLLTISRAKLVLYYASRRREILASLALDPFTYFLDGYKDWGITRDGDSFFPVSKKSARNSALQALGVPLPTPPDHLGELPPWHPSYATNLTDEQWAVLAPLIPPDPWADWLTGEPPMIIAANRWGFSLYAPTSEFNDFVIMEDYNRILQRCPALMTPPPSRAKKRGRPRNETISPRALLDAILWKLATGQTWDALPMGFPPTCLCRKYYRRLFLSGCLYTLLLALYNHLCLEAVVDPYLLLEQGFFTTTPSQAIALSPQAPPTWQNYTALLFMQLAREAFSRSWRETKRKKPYLCRPPILKGQASLSDGGFSSSSPAQDTPEFQPLEFSPAYEKIKKIEQFEKIQERMTRKLQRNLNPGK